MEQLVARRAHNPKVAGSSPASATKKKGRCENSGLFVFKALYTWLPQFTPRRLINTICPVE